MNRQQGITGVLVLLLVLATIATAAYFKWIPIDLQNKTKEDIESSTANWPIFESKVANYSFQYPPDWDLIEIPERAQAGQPDFIAHSPGSEYNEFGGWQLKGMSLDVSVEEEGELSIPASFIPEMTIIPSHLATESVGARRDPSNTNPESYDALARVKVANKTVSFYCRNVTGKQNFAPESCVNLLKTILSTFKLTDIN